MALGGRQEENHRGKREDSLLEGVREKITRGAMGDAIDIHHHYVPHDVIDEARKSGKALGVEVADLPNHRVGLAFGGGKPHMLQPALMDVEKRLEIMAKG